MGRPAKELDDLVQQKIIQVVERGGTRRCAAQAAGVAPSTLFKWIARGRKGDGEPFVEFSERIARAEATAETTMSDSLFEAGKEDARLALEWLARRRPKSWGKRDAAPISAPARASAYADAAAHMTSEEARARLAEMAVELLEDPEIAALVEGEVGKKRAAT